MNNTTLEELRKPLRYQFNGDEYAFETHIIEQMDEIIEIMELPPIKVLNRQKQIRFSGGQVIVDIMMRHIDGSATIFEVKKRNTKNPHTSTYEQMMGIGQILLYGNVFEDRTGVKPRLVLIDNKIHERTMKAFLGNELPITLMELQDNRLFIPYRAY